MKLSRILALISLVILFVLSPSALRAQEIQVRIFTAVPLKSVTVVSTKGDFRWRECPTCPDHSGGKLTVDSAQSHATPAAPLDAKDISVTGSYQVIPAMGPVFSASFPLRIKKNAGGLIVTVSMPLEQYVQAVLAAESGGFQYGESLKAMAVVARTYALHFRSLHAPDGFDFCDTTHCQVLRWNSVNERGRSAVEATRGEILSFRDAPAATFYHQNCGGTTAAGSEAWSRVSEPYLIVHSDTFCPIPGTLKWQSSLPVADIDRALRDSSIAAPQGWRTIEISSRTPSGRADHLKLLGGNPPQFILSSSTLRFAVDRALGWSKIRSDLYDISNSPGQVSFSGRGSGHGVGLCQAGAEEMAREGKSYREILSFYYPGTNLGPAQTEKWQNRFDERFELFSTNPEGDSQILPIAEKLLKENETAIGWKLPFRVRLQPFSTMDRYRDATGEPGWVAASTRLHTIRLQPLAELRARSILEPTLRHELYHLLVEARAKVATPLWFREGLVLYLSNPNGADPAPSPLTSQQLEAVLQHPASRDEMEKAYTVARSRVTELIRRNGKQAVFAWLAGGIPRDVTAALP